MTLKDWFCRLLSRRPREEAHIPEIMGYTVDKQGKRVAIHRGPLQHHNLTPEQVSRVARLREVLAEAYPMTMEGWVDGFLRDANPESEIRIIEACAAVYRRLTSQAALSPREKKRLYSLLCAVSTGARGPELEAALPAGRALPGFETVVEMYREAVRSGERP